MNDQQLAGRIVAILGWHPDIRKQPGFRGDNQFVTDWRVAGAMLEKMSRAQLIVAFLGQPAPKYHYLDLLRDPRAINEACCEALSDE